MAINPQTGLEEDDDLPPPPVDTGNADMAALYAGLQTPARPVPALPPISTNLSVPRNAEQPQIRNTPQDPYVKNYLSKLAANDLAQKEAESKYQAGLGPLKAEEVLHGLFGALGRVTGRGEGNTEDIYKNKREELRQEVLGGPIQQRAQLNKDVANKIAIDRNARLLGREQRIGENQESMAALQKQKLENELNKGKVGPSFRDALATMLEKRDPSLASMIRTMDPNDALKFAGIHAKEFGIEENAKAKEATANVKYGENDEKVKREMYKDLQKDLDTNTSARGNLSKAQGAINAVKRFNALARDENGNPRNLNPQMMEEATIGMNAILTGGGSPGARAQIEALAAHTFGGDSAKAIQWLTANPTGAGQQAFLKNMLETADRELKQNQQIIHEGLKARLGRYTPLKGENMYKDIVKRHGLDPETESMIPTENLGVVPVAAPAGKIKVRRKMDGQAGTILESDFDPKKYEKL